MSSSLPYVVPTPSPLLEPSERLYAAERNTRRAVYHLLTAASGLERDMALANMEFACKYEATIRQELLGDRQ